MRLRFAVCLFAVATTLAPVFAADEGKLFFIPTKSGDNAQVVDEAGKIKAIVLEAIMGQRPENCPPSAYWIEKKPVDAYMADALVSCDDATKTYQLIQTPESAMRGGYAVVRANNPKPGGDTDEPGPLKSEPEPEPKANP